MALQTQKLSKWIEFVLDFLRVLVYRSFDEDVKYQKILEIYKPSQICYKSQ